jgi:hypothetical protein
MRLDDFIHSRTFATRSEQLIKIAGTDEVKPTNILRQVQKMNRMRGDFEREYDYLCEQTRSVRRSTSSRPSIRVTSTFLPAVATISRRT